MGEGNDFVKREQQEMEKSNSETIASLIAGIRGLVDLIKDVQKEVHTVREELRNLDKLRPLRTKAEEAAEEEVKSE